MSGGVLVIMDICYNRIVIMKNKKNLKILAKFKNLFIFSRKIFPYILSIVVMGYLLTWLYPQESKAYLSKFSDFFVELLANLQNKSSANVSLKLHKENYSQGEDIHFTVYNNNQTPIYYLFNSETRPELHYYLYAEKNKKTAIKLKTEFIKGMKVGSIAANKSLDLVMELPWEKSFSQLIDKALMDEYIKYPEAESGKYQIGFSYAMKKADSSYDLIKPIKKSFSPTFEINKEQKVVIKTDKLQYKTDERIGITLINTYPNGIYYLYYEYLYKGNQLFTLDGYNTLDFYKKKNDQWEKIAIFEPVHPLYAKLGRLFNPSPGNMEFPMETIRKNFAEKEYYNKNFILLKNNLDSGRYKLGLNYSFKGEKEAWNYEKSISAKIFEPIATAYSNEFEIE